MLRVPARVLCNLPALRQSCRAGAPVCRCRKTAGICRTGVSCAGTECCSSSTPSQGIDSLDTSGGAAMMGTHLRPSTTSIRRCRLTKETPREAPAAHSLDVRCNLRVTERRQKQFQESTKVVKDRPG